MEPMDGEQGLERDRRTVPASGDESTDINAERPWTFLLQSQAGDNRENNPKLVVSFNTKVEVHALKLQGNTDQKKEVRFILSFPDEATSTFKEVQDSSGSPLVSSELTSCFLFLRYPAHLTGFNSSMYSKKNPIK